jgi:magnesium-protoporphyrin O-methyltransferase
VDCCGCGFASIFDREAAQADLDRYRKNGPDRTTQLLLDLVRPFVATGSTILDVGSGIGVIAHELLRSDAGHAILVDGSPASLEAAREEARRRGTLDRVELIEGDFVSLSPGIDPADVVTLDRVVCCYPDAVSLVGTSAARARGVYGLVLPRDGWHTRLLVTLDNLRHRVLRNTYRAYAHSNEMIDGLVASHGLTPQAERSTRFWRVVVYAR